MFVALPRELLSHRVGKRDNEEMLTLHGRHTFPFRDISFLCTCVLELEPGLVRAGQAPATELDPRAS